MGFFDKIFKKKDDFAFDDRSPPDFSSSSDPFDTKSSGDDPFGGKDPLQNDFQYNAQAPMESQTSSQSNFNHDLFTNEQPTNADNAREFAQGLGGQASTPRQAGSFAQPATSAVTGHEAELILERLDTIKAELDAIKQRMYRIENFINQSEHKTSATQRRYF
jgi:hypothetical protein